MRNLTRSFNYVVPLCSAVLFLFCISPSAYATFQAGPEGMFIFPKDEGLQQFIPPGPNPNLGAFPDNEIIKKFREEIDSVVYPPWGLIGIGQPGKHPIEQPHIKVNFDDPTSTDLISISAWGWFNDGGQRPLSATYSIVGNTINIEIILQDLYGAEGIAYITSFTGCGDTVDIGALAEGQYTVNANIYLVPWGSSEPVLYESNSTFFDVVSSVGEFSSINAVPEPATLLLLVLGGLALRRKR